MYRHAFFNSMPWNCSRSRDRLNGGNGTAYALAYLLGSEIEVCIGPSPAMKRHSSRPPRGHPRGCFARERSPDHVRVIGVTSLSRRWTDAMQATARKRARATDLAELTDAPLLAGGWMAKAARPRPTRCRAASWHLCNPQRHRSSNFPIGFLIRAIRDWRRLVR